MAGDTEVGRIVGKLELDDSQFSRGMGQAEGKWNQFGRTLSSTSGPIGGISSSLGAIASPAGIAAASIGAVGVALIKSTQAAIGWESTMADVQKTAGASTDVQQLGDALLTMSTVPGMPVKEDLADIAANAGALGVDGTQNVLDFTDAIAKATTSFGGMGAGEVASNLAKMENVFGISADQSMNLAAAVDYVGNNLAATEAQVMPAAQKMSGLGSMYGMTATDALGLAGSLIDLGMQAERAGTLTSSLMTKLTDPASWGRAGELIGMTADEFGRLATEDIDEAILEIAEALEAIADPAERAQAIADLKLGTEAAQPLLKMVGHTEDIRANMEGVADAFEDTSDFIGNFDNKAETSAAKIGAISAQVGVIAVNFGDAINNSETFQAVLDGIYGTLEKFIEWQDSGGIGGTIERATEDVRGWVDSKAEEGGWLDAYLTNYDEAKVRDAAAKAGEESGEGYSEGVGETTGDLGEKTAEELGNDDAKKAAKESGKKSGIQFAEGFDEESIKYFGKTDYSAYAGDVYGASIRDANGDAISQIGADWKDASYTIGMDIGDGLSAGIRQTATGRGSLAKNYYNVLIGEHEYRYTQQDLADALGGPANNIQNELWAVQDAMQKYAADTGIVLDVPLSVQYDWIGEPELAAEERMKEAAAAEAERLREIAQDEFEAAFDDALEVGFAVGGLGDTMADLLKEVAEDGWQAFEDGIITASEASDIAEQLADLKFADTEAFEVAGGQAALDWWSRFAGLLDQRAYNIANNIDCTGINEEIQKHIDAGEPYIAKVEVEFDIWDRPDISGELSQLGAYNQALFVQSKLVNPLTSSLEQCLNEGVIPLTGGLDEQAEAYYYLEDAINVAIDTEGLFNGELEKTLENFDLANASAEDYIALLKLLGGELVGVGEAAVDTGNLLNGAMTTAEAACTECQEAMSEFGIWQEENANRLFNQSFIGPTDDYQKFLEAETARGAIHPEPIQLSMVYKAETAEADAALEELKESASETQYMPIEIDDAAAYSAIQAIEAAASSPVIKPVYVQQYGDTGGASSSSSGWLNSICPSCQSDPGWGTPDWLPHLAGGGIVAHPLTAVVGDAPSPEVIAPIDDLMRTIQGAVGGSGPVIHSTINVYGGTVIDEAELQAILTQRDEKLRNEVARTYLGR